MMVFDDTQRPTNEQIGCDSGKLRGCEQLLSTAGGTVHRVKDARPEIKGVARLAEGLQPEIKLKKQKIGSTKEAKRKGRNALPVEKLQVWAYATPIV